MKNEGSEKGSQKVEHGKAKRKSTTETEVPMNVFSVKYQKIFFHKYYMKNKRSSEGSCLKVKHSRAKHKLITETVAPLNVVSA